MWGNICAFPHILGSPSSYMTLQLLHSEFPHIWGKLGILFYQCVNRYKRLIAKLHTVSKIRFMYSQKWNFSSSFPFLCICEQFIYSPDIAACTYILLQDIKKFKEWRTRILLKTILNSIQNAELNSAASWLGYAESWMSCTQWWLSYAASWLGCGASWLNYAKIMTELRRIMTEFLHIMTELRRIITELRRTMTELRRTMSQLHRIMNELRRMMTELRRIWLSYAASWLSYSAS